MGPDEYHDAYPGAEQPGLDDNAYTNVMAVWTLLRARDALDLLREDRSRRLRDRLGVREEELEEWESIARKMIPFHGQGIISQFDGYEQLEEFDWEGYRERYHDIQRLDRVLEAEGDTPNRYKASKQADVLMLFYLLRAEELEIFTRLGYPWDRDTIPRNVAYYRPERLMVRPCPGWSTPGCCHVPTVPSHGICSAPPWNPTWATSRAGRLRRASISAPWPEPSI